MDIKIFILDKDKKRFVKPEEFIYHGDCAIERAIYMFVELYFSPHQCEEVKMLMQETKCKLDDILKVRGF
jgi:5-bromo-4-chloroindolyl phosphate hydrolysis protein